MTQSVNDKGIMIGPVSVTICCQQLPKYGEFDLSIMSSLAVWNHQIETSSQFTKT